MPQYRALAPLYVRTSAHSQAIRIRAGETFASEDPPGRNWFPLDPEGRARFIETHGREPVDRKDHFPIVPSRL